MSYSEAIRFLDQAEEMVRGKLGAFPNCVIWRGLYGHTIINRTYETIIVGMSDDKSGEYAPEIVLLTILADQNTQVHLDEDAGHGEQSWVGGFGGISELSGVWDAIRYLELFFRPPAP